MSIKKQSQGRCILNVTKTDMASQPCFCELLRTCDRQQKREAYERQKGICVHCHKHFELEEMEADHITPWKEGGTTVADNCQMLCRNCNRIKGAK